MVAQAFQPVPRQLVSLTQPGKVVPPFIARKAVKRSASRLSLVPKLLLGPPSAIPMRLSRKAGALPAMGFPSGSLGTSHYAPETPVCLPSPQHPLLMYNLRSVHGKEKAPPGPELASRDLRYAVAGSKLIISWLLSEKNLLLNLLPNNFLGKIIRGTHLDAQRGAAALPPFQP